MGAPRVLPTIALMAVVVVVGAPVAVALRMMSDQPRSSAGAKKSTATDKPADPPAFDGERAYGYLVEQCRIGPRISGTDGNRTLRKRLVEQFEKCEARATRQRFEARHPQTGEPVEMENIVAAWHPDLQRRVLIGAHFDTRPRADRETDSRKRAQPFLGANDGASGVAVLMELANQMSDLQTTVGVDFVCFDGEELVYGEDGDYFLGSTHFAQEYRKTRGDIRYVAAIVIDMIGDRQLEIYPDEVSLRESPQLVREVWGIARRLGASAFKTGRGHDIRDDHLPLLDVGIPAIDIIDFDYGKNNSYWHTTEDTPDKCSAASLAQVGRVLAAWLRGK